MEEDELPAGWVVATLAQLGQWTSGGTPSKKRPDYHNGQIPWVLTGDLDDGAVKDVPNAITDAGLKNSSAKIFPPGTLLMAMYGATIGKLGVLQREAATNQACAALLPSEANNEALPYVYFYLLSKREQFKKAGKGGAQPNISQGVIKDTAIPVAPLPEQQRIVEKIETLFAELDKGEEALREVQKLLARYRQSVLKAAVTGTLTADWRAANSPPQESGADLLSRILKTRREIWQGRGKYKTPVEPNTEGLPELPEGWTWASIDQLAELVEYGSSAKCSTEVDGVPVLRMGNIVDGALDFASLKFLPPEHEEFPKLLLSNGDLVFNRTNSAELVGKTAVYKGQREACSFASYLIRARLIEASPDLVAAYINSLCGRAWVKSVVSQQVGQANVNGTKLKALAVPLPPLDEQAEIIERLEDGFSRISKASEWCHAELKRSAALRQSILKDAFSGKLVPQNPSDEPADKLLERVRAARAEKPNAKRKKARA